ncbi:BR serine/threonine kinase [Nematocida major]|uniref:BR serine/threonine kinase n=1 Tax=Nematocida major TaxID=1912982 RepID=UPI002007EC95|nr:BR serine/threonine kinase [Nematocida major]KAH9387308.1 BR serine/threonine kinase [Nematocida major]
MGARRVQSSITMQHIPTTKKIEEEGQIYFEVYTSNGLARSISSPAPLRSAYADLPAEESFSSQKFVSLRILYSISRNQNSHVFLGRSISTGKLLVVKMISTRTRENQAQVKNETNLLPGLLHRNIIRYFGHDHFLRTATIYLEYFKSVELFSLLQQNRILPVGLALHIFRELADALSYMHERRICHLDIKPENILINSRLQIKLIDFGMSQRALKNGLVEAYGGSVNYASPEAVEGGVYNGFLADSWSCGVVLFLMVNGSFPVSSASPSLPHVPREILRILERLLRISPNERSPIQELEL